MSTLGLISSGAVGVVASHPLSMRERPGSIPSLSMPMCALRWSFSLRVCCASRQKRLLQGTVFSAEALSRPARPAFLLPFCCRRTPLVGSRCGQRSAGPPVRPLVFLSAAGALLWFLSFSSLLPAQAREAKLLWLAAPSGPSALKAMRSRPAQLRGSWCSGITPAQHARGAGFNPRPVHAHVRLRLSQFASPWSFIHLGLLCVLPRPAGTPRPGAKRHF